ncbi:MAG: hypothetical protein ACD_73C00180G0002 [uncultured bacterium]|nr:MAG: hypothetical protein ACD_73C00180G0002 [uncultured bacterium]
MKMSKQKILFFALFTLLAMGIGPYAGAATFTVDSNTLAADATPGDGLCATAGAVCTLQAAMDEAKMLGGANTINLTAGMTISSSAVCSTCSTAAFPDITTDITLNGNGSTLVITGAGVFGGMAFLNVYPIGTLTLTDMTLTGGYGEEGGAINNLGILNLQQTIFSNNTACANASGEGGALYVDGVANIFYSTFDSNICTNGTDGGAIYGTAASTISISNSSITNNTASGAAAKGGGVSSIGTLTIRKTTFYGNSADHGGGLHFYGTAGSLFRVTMNNNTAATLGGGLYNGPNGVPGVSPLTVDSSIIAGNTALGGADCFDTNANITSSGFNLIADQTSCDGAVVNDLEGASGLGAYVSSAVAGRSNLPLTALSAAIDAGQLATCDNGDQLVSEDAGTCDMGAIEYGVCGDGSLLFGEACDDGNAVDTDACTNACQSAACGDGILWATGGELCDDGNVTDGDGCSSICDIEVNGSNNITVTIQDCETVYNADNDISLGEAILLANGDLAWAALSNAEKQLVPDTVGAGGDQVYVDESACGANCILDVSCVLPEITAFNLSIGGNGNIIYMDAQGLITGESALNISGPGFDVEDIELSGSGSGIGLLATGDNFTLRRAAIDDFEIGVQADSVSGVIIGGGGGESTDGNSFTNNTVGMLIKDSTDIDLKYNTFGLRDGFFVASNEYGLAMTYVSDVEMQYNVLAASTQAGLLVSGADSLNMDLNYFGTNMNGSRPLGTDSVQTTGARFEIITQSLADGLIPATDSGATISNVNMGLPTDASGANVFCYNTDNLLVSGTNVNVTIGINSYCAGSTPYSLREGANSGGGEPLSVPTITSIDISDVASDGNIVSALKSGETYDLIVNGSAQAGVTVRLYLSQVMASLVSSEQANADTSEYLCDVLTDVVGNFESTCAFTLADNADELQVQAQACSDSCVWASEFSETTSFSLVENSGATGAGFQNGQSGGGCSLNPHQR